MCLVFCNSHCYKVLRSPFLNLVFLISDLRIRHAGTGDHWIPRRNSSSPATLHSTSTPLQFNQHPCRDPSQAVQDVKRAAKNATSRDQFAAAARPRERSASMRCSCSGEVGHSRDRDSGPAWARGTCRDWVCEKCSQLYTWTDKVQNTRPANSYTPPSQRRSRSRPSPAPT